MAERGIALTPTLRVLTATLGPDFVTRFAARNACSVLACRYTSRGERICALKPGPVE